jgi:ribonuclease VapC
MTRASGLMMSAPTLFECRLVALRKSGVNLEAKIPSVINDLNIRIVAFDGPQAALAADAFRRFGKGRDRAALNFGDCLRLGKACERAALVQRRRFRADRCRRSHLNGAATTPILRP